MGKHHTNLKETASGSYNRNSVRWLVKISQTKMEQSPRVRTNYAKMNYVHESIIFQNKLPSENDDTISKELGSQV